MPVCDRRRRIGMQAAREQLVGHEHRDRDDVIDHRCPRAWPKDALGVEHRLEEREKPVEEDLRQQQVGKGGGLHGIDLAVLRQHHAR